MDNGLWSKIKDIIYKKGSIDNPYTAEEWEDSKPSYPPQQGYRAEPLATSEQVEAGSRKDISDDPEVRAQQLESIKEILKKAKDLNEITDIKRKALHLDDEN